MGTENGQLPADTSRTELGLWLLLGLAMLVRLPGVFFGHGFEFLDEQYQYVDPAYHLAFGGSWAELPDYTNGLRSWIYPGFLSGLMRLSASLGIEGPLSMLVFVRFLHALISLIPVWALWKFAGWKGFRDRRKAILFTACCFLPAYLGIRTNSPAFAAGLSVAAVLLFHGRGLYPLLAGLFLGFAFCCRFQDALLGPVLFVSALLMKRPRAALLLCLGCLGPVLLQGFQDLEVHGTFLHSPFAYLNFNLFQGGSAGWGNEPIYYYALLFIGFTLLAPPFLRTVLTHLRQGAAAMPVVFVAVCAYLVLHTVPAHKAFRFVQPALMLLVLLVSYSLFEPKTTRTWQGLWHKRIYISLSCIAWLFLSLFFFNRGPIEAALYLREQPEFQDRLLMVDGSQVSIGGHYYLGRKQMEVTGIPRKDFIRHLSGLNLKKPLFVMVGGKRPLEKELLEASPHPIRFLKAFADWPEFKRRSRRYVYRIDPR